MSGVAGPSVIPRLYEDLATANDLPEPNSRFALDNDEYHDPEWPKDVARVSEPSIEEQDLRTKGVSITKFLPPHNRSRFSVPPRPLSSSLTPIDHTPSLSFERLAFRMDLEDLKRKMTMERQEGFRPYPAPRTSKDHWSSTPPDQTPPGRQEHRTHTPYSMKLSRNTRRLSRRSRRGIGMDSSQSSAHPGERNIRPSILYG